MKKALLYALFLLFSNIINAQVPSAYYDSASGKSGSELKTALFNIIQGHTAVSYTPGVWNAYYTTDVDYYYENDGSVLDMYSENPDGTDPYNFALGTDQDNGSSVAEGVLYNREHSFPKSWFGGSVSPMYTDIFHVYPTDKVVNSKRSNWPYGEVSSATWTSANGSKVGPSSYPGYTGTVFEPIDEFKGDFARTYFYMATRYEDAIGSWEINTTESNAILDGTSYPCYETWFLEMLIQWHNNDPVSQKEIDRNDAVYDIQNNRNPFIDHPEYVCLIWGSNCGTAQSEIFKEDFETSTENQVIAINGWTVYNEDGTKSWEGRIYNSNRYTQMSAYNTGETSNISWLITPSIDLTATSTATFSFNSKDGYNNGDPVQVYISTNYTGSGDPNSSTWFNLNPTIATGTTTGYAASFTESGSINIDDYCGNSVFIAFKYTGGDPSLTTTIQIDDILITGDSTPANELPVITNVQYIPTDPESTENVVVSANITDSDGSISLAQLKWGLTSGSLSNIVSMSNSGNAYSGIIPAQTNGSNVYFIVYTEDNNGGTAQSAELSYLVKDFIAPVINDVQINPTNPTENDDVSVLAKVSDSDGTITSAILKWKIGASGNYSDITMNASGNDYTAEIPKQNVGVTIYFNLVAKDNDALETTYEGNYTVSAASSSEMIERQELKLYPNPINENLFIELYDDNIQSVKIYNLIGKKVYELSNVDSPNQSISFIEFSKGIYIIQIEGNKNSFTHRIVY